VIITKLIGGLGNQMFQYAAAKALGIKWQTPVCVDLNGFETLGDYTPRQYELHVFEAKVEIAKDIELNRFKDENKFKNHFRFFTGNKNKYAVEKTHAYNVDFNSLPSNTYLNGFWQSERYFKSIEKTIRADFKIKPSLLTNIENWMSKIKACNSVSMHIRRGDYVSNDTTNAFHGLCDLSYYENSVAYLTSKIKSFELFVFSDDIAWCRTNIRFSQSVHFISETNAYEDLHLMHLCQHNIIANSSFSWWGAWLNNYKSKIVIAPKQWFADTKVDTKDIIPESWIKV
jgi:hypothetical protein